MTQQATTTKHNTNNEPQGIDWDSVEGGNQDFQDVYPRLQWMHGKRNFKQLGEKNMNFTGGLFLPENQYAGFSADGWSEASFTPSGVNSSEVKGWYSPKANLSVIRIKRWWDDDGSHTHALLSIKGVDGLFCIQVGGISKGQAFETAFADHRKQIVAAANRTKPEGRPGIEPYALWFVLATSPHSMQKAKTKDAESEVTLPRLFVPATIDTNYVRSLWVGTDNYKQFSALYKETENWQNQIPKKQNNVNNADTINDAKLKELVDLCLTKDYSEADLAMTASEGKTNKLEMLNYREAREAMEILKSY